MNYYYVDSALVGSDSAVVYGSVYYWYTLAQTRYII
jgi:hypothetical protein